METLADRRRRFREQMNRREAMIVPGAGNALTARVIADKQFEAEAVRLRTQLKLKDIQIEARLTSRL